MYVCLCVCVYVCMHVCMSNINFSSPSLFTLSLHPLSPPPLQFESGNAKNIDAPYVAEGRPLTVDEYVKSKVSFGSKFASFFSNGGLVKF